MVLSSQIIYIIDTEIKVRIQYFRSGSSANNLFQKLQSKYELQKVDEITDLQPKLDQMIEQIANISNGVAQKLSQTIQTVEAKTEVINQLIMQNSGSDDYRLQQELNGLQGATQKLNKTIETMDAKERLALIQGLYLSCPIFFLRKKIGQVP